MKVWKKGAIVGVGVIGLTQILIIVLSISNIFRYMDLPLLLNLFFIFGFPFLIYYKYSRSTVKSILIASLSFIIFLIWAVFLGVVAFMQA